MLRFVRLNDCAAARTVGARGLTVLAVALAAGGCSAGFDRLGPLNYNGGPTGSAAPLPPASMRSDRSSPPPSSYQPEYRSEPRSDYRSGPRAGSEPDYRADDPPAYRPPYGDRRSDASSRGTPPMSRGDDSIRVAGLPEPYDRTPAAPPAARPATQVAPFEARRTPPVPPRAAYEPQPEAAPAATTAAGGTIEVRPGDTLYKLSKTHGVSVAELMEANGLKGTNLRVGQQLTLPSEGRRTRRVASLPTSAPTPYAEPAPYIPPTPQRTSAPAPAAQSPFSSSPQPSRDAGPMVPPLVESPPDAAPAAAPTVPPPAVAARADESGWSGSYTVERGDSLYSVARKHGVRLNELERANNITNPRAIKPGTVLKVPQTDESKVARASAPSAATPPAAPTRAAEAPAATLDQSGAPSVRPTILNPSEAPTEERRRVAALERIPGIAEQPASPASPRAPAATATDAPQRDAALTSPKAAAPAGKFRWPVRGKVIMGFGPQQGGGQNEGINISVPRGTAIHAAEAGSVTYAGDGVQGYGNLVLIRHPEGWITAYAHNDQLLVKSGESVRRGQIIAKAGNSGSVTQPQLHFELRQGTKPIDPMEHLER